MDKIFLHGMKIEAAVGAHEWQRVQKQPLSANITLGIASQSATSDRIGDTVNFAEIHQTIHNSLKEQQFLLLEGLAEYLANLMLQDFAAQWVQIRLVKAGALPNVREAGVEIERSKTDRTE